MTGSSAALVSLDEASGLLAELAGVRVESKQAERCAEALGREIAAAERTGAFPSENPPAPTMYLGLDGTGLPVRGANDIAALRCCILSGLYEGFWAYRTDHSTDERNCPTGPGLRPCVSLSGMNGATDQLPGESIVVQRPLDDLAQPCLQGGKACLGQAPRRSFTVSPFALSVGPLLGPASRC